MDEPGGVVVCVPKLCQGLNTVSTVTPAESTSVMVLTPAVFTEKPDEEPSGLTVIVSDAPEFFSMTVTTVPSGDIVTMEEFPPAVTISSIVVPSG